MILGGRYMEEKFEGKMMGQPFLGAGWFAYDNYKKKYLSTWVDNMGTGIMMMSGTYDTSGKVLTSWGTMDDVAAKKTLKVKTVTTSIDADNSRFEMWMPSPDGKMWKSMEIHYTRQK